MHEAVLSSPSRDLPVRHSAGRKEYRGTAMDSAPAIFLVWIHERAALWTLHVAIFIFIKLGRAISTVWAIPPFVRRIFDHR